jgi:hypothetical protein
MKDCKVLVSARSRKFWAGNQTNWSSCWWMYGKTCAAQECTPCLTSELYHLVEACETDPWSIVTWFGAKGQHPLRDTGYQSTTILSSISSEMPLGHAIWGIPRRAQPHPGEAKIPTLDPFSKKCQSGIRDNTKTHWLRLRAAMNRLLWLPYQPVTL